MAHEHQKNLVAAIRNSLDAKIERVLLRPIIARLGDGEATGHAERADEAEDDRPEAFRSLLRGAGASATSRAAAARDPWTEDPEDGTCTVRVSVDYDDLWRGRHKEVLDAVKGSIDGTVTFLTDEQRTLLERKPREFLALIPQPPSADLLDYIPRDVGGIRQVVGLKVGVAPELRKSLRHVALVPNLVQLLRQRDALAVVESATDGGPLGPLRALVGLHASGLAAVSCLAQDGVVPPSARLDEYQLECVKKALSSPHFSVIKGPPGSGKTTVISSVVQAAVQAGDNVLIVSPTHVAVDNVVEKLVTVGEHGRDDWLEPHTLPVRYAARPRRLSATALAYWIGPKKQRRGATIASRVEASLRRTVPFAAMLFAMENKKAPGIAPISSGVSGADDVVCGTPIGILSYGPVKAAEPGSFGVLIVDEVSKMTLPEFLAIAVKARRWVLVGDPEQLPPFNGSEDNSVTLDDVLAPRLELGCSVAALVGQSGSGRRGTTRMVVVSSDPANARDVIEAQLGSPQPAVRLFADQEQGTGVLVCAAGELDEACDRLSPVRVADRTHNQLHVGTLDVLVERGVSVPRPSPASGRRLVESKDRAQALLFDKTFTIYHSYQWSARAKHRLPALEKRHTVERLLPSEAALRASQHADGGTLDTRSLRRELEDVAALRFAVNAVSVYDWLTGIDGNAFDVPFLRKVVQMSRTNIVEAVAQYVGILKKQYRMHSTISLVPRNLFYFGEALQDGRPDDKPGRRVNLVQVDGDSKKVESNDNEIEKICEMLRALNRDRAATPPRVMIITPYSEQEEALKRAVARLEAGGETSNLSLEICTLDRCQGRESEYVIISLVLSSATTFFDMPKRWNVALTRAQKGLFIVGDIAAYREEAAKRVDRTGRSTRPGYTKPASLLSCIIAAYDKQISDSPRIGTTTR